ncbi:Pyruvate/2-oxoglutarate dehydrogenase complex, dihydrolipoamide dehydrogenase (E3) component [Mariniphaga anaerophila]|uniref:Pyruvate/2-oxoglutarate dehydrogenase complex, dihydrolipoamide dehydrogenase (E3) component n=1 Tax=Mariniphaga anaerophila TaxID=1484053 RepID=A0A1M4WTR2_9BACT|nr:FAD-dependent oxidoreductase [Mariniphaga anaerophila]SHE84547.1 Pyruvate/2-oxoglutarate dehydrogenase complex, dihydrolipoamide dehydrogenase (E3) component [Mariniphaga anaerophila]
MEDTKLKTDVLVIGSSAAGLVSALTGKRVYPERKFTVVTRFPKTLIPCGIPYIFGSVGSSDKDILPSEKMFETNNVDMLVDEAESIQLKEKTVRFQSGKVIGYEKLVIGTGSLPIQPQWLKGAGLENVFNVPKNKVYLDEMHEKLKGANKIVTIGAGFIGVEISDELRKAGKDVTLVEKLPRILGLAFDGDISERAEELLKNRGVKILTGASVAEISGNGKVDGVVLENGERIEADAVILSMGYKPNSELAAGAGLPVSDRGFIKVDDYMRTTDPDVFAVGDCAEKRDFITRKPSPVMLASTACAEARIAGMNLFKLSAIKTFIGTISIFSTAIGTTGFGVAGITETQAEAENFDFVTGTFEGIDRHPGALEDTHKQFVKLVVGRESGVILGGEVYGGLSAGELTNTLGIIVQNRMTLNSLLTAQFGTHPLLTASPAGYPLVKAAESAAGKIMFK